MAYNEGSRFPDRPNRPTAHYGLERGSVYCTVHLKSSFTVVQIRDMVFVLARCFGGGARNVTTVVETS